MTIEERRAEIEKQHPKYVFDRVDRNQTLYYHDPRCDRCGGTGYVPYNVDSGIGDAAAAVVTRSPAQSSSIPRLMRRSWRHSAQKGKRNATPSA